jgi:hypothetical protein
MWDYSFIDRLIDFIGQFFHKSQVLAPKFQKYVMQKQHLSIGEKFYLHYLDLNWQNGKIWAIVHFYSLRLVLIDTTRPDGQQQNASIKCEQREYKTNGIKIISRLEESITKSR